MLSVEYQKSITEVLDILDNTDESLVNKIPKKFLKFLNENKSDTYIPNLEYDKELENMNLMPKTKTILSIIYMKYWSDENELRNVKQVQYDNEKKHQNMLEEKYSYDNLFKKDKTVQSRKEAVDRQLVQYRKENMFVRIIKKLVNLFKNS